MIAENSPSSNLPTECRPAHDAAMRLLDGIADWDSGEARLHRERCSRCKAELASAKLIQPGYSITVKPSHDLAGRILMGIDRDRSRRRTMSWIGMASAGALAASLMIAVFSGVFDPQSNGQLGQNVEVAVVPEPVVFSAFDDARSSLATLTRKITDNTDPEALSIPTPKIPLAKSGDDFETLVEARDTAVKSIAPITSTARRAFSAFLRTAQPLNPTPVQ